MAVSDKLFPAIEPEEPEPHRPDAVIRSVAAVDSRVSDARVFHSSPEVMSFVGCVFVFQFLVLVTAG